MKVSRELIAWAVQQLEHAQDIAMRIAANLELYADRPWPPGLATALAAQTSQLSEAMMNERLGL